MTTKTVVAYFHGDKDEMRLLGAKAGLFGDALDKFTHALYEVKLTLEVNNETGEYKIIKTEEK